MTAPCQPPPACLPRPRAAAAAAAKAQQVFERCAERHGFSFTHLPKVTGDAAARAQLRNAGACPGGSTSPRALSSGRCRAALRAASCASPAARRPSPCLLHRQLTFQLTDALTLAVAEGEYFLTLLPDGSRLVHPIAHGERFPLAFGREVLAELVGAPER